MKHTHSYQLNEKVYGQGEAATYIYQVVSGAARIFSKLNSGERQIGSFCFPGDIFGLEPGPRHRRSAEAVVEATTLRRVKRKAIVKKAQSNLSLARILWNLTVRDLLHAEDRSVILGLAATCDYIGVSEETISREISKLAAKGVLGRNGSSRLVRRLKLNRPERLRAMLPPLFALALPPISEKLIQTIFSPKNR